MKRLTCTRGEPVRTLSKRPTTYLTLSADADPDDVDIAFGAMVDFLDNTFVRQRGRDAARKKRGRAIKMEVDALKEKDGGAGDGGEGGEGGDPDGSDLDAMAKGPGTMQSQHRVLQLQR